MFCIRSDLKITNGIFFSDFQNERDFTLYKMLAIIKI